MRAQDDPHYCHSCSDVSQDGMKGLVALLESAASGV